MPLIKADWSEPDEAGLQTAEYGGLILRVFPAAAPETVQELRLYGKEPRAGFRWEVGIAPHGGGLDSGWIDTRAAARTEALGRAHRSAIGTPAPAPPPTARAVV